MNTRDPQHPATGAELDEAKGITNEALARQMDEICDRIREAEQALEMLELMSELTLPQRREMFDLMRSMLDDRRCATHVHYGTLS